MTHPLRNHAAFVFLITTIFIGLTLTFAVNGKAVNADPPHGPVQSPTPTPLTPVDRQKDTFEEIDLESWVKEFSKLGTTSFARDEFYMSSKTKGYYYVLVAPEEYISQNATTRVKLRNVLGASSTLGYGLVLHSNQEPLVQGYAFLIDTVRKRFRVVRHVPGSEKPVIPWTNSPLINAGKLENTLEAVDKGDTTELFINRQFVASFPNTYAFKNGSPGLYSGDKVKVAFKEFTLGK